MSDTLQLVIVVRNTQLERNASPMSDTLQLVVVVPQTQLLSDPSFPLSLSVARHYDKLNEAYRTF